MGKQNPRNNTTDRKCYRCDEPFEKGHMKTCKAINAVCSSCNIKGHYAKACKKRPTKSITTDENPDGEADLFII